MEKKTSPLSMRIDAETKAALERLAAADKRSLNGYIKFVLESHVEAKAGLASEKRARP